MEKIYQTLFGFSERKKRENSENRGGDNTLMSLMSASVKWKNLSILNLFI